MSIYSLDIKGMRKALRKFQKTLYGQTVFLIAYFVPFLTFLMIIGFGIATVIAYDDKVLNAFFISLFAFIISFLIGNAYYYAELRKFLEKN